MLYLISRMTILFTAFFHLLFNRRLVLSYLLLQNSGCVEVHLIKPLYRFVVGKGSILTAFFRERLLSFDTSPKLKIIVPND